MKIISLMFIVSLALLALPACFEGEAPKSPRPKPVTIEQESVPEKEVCAHGDAYPFSKCGKKYSKQIPLETLPRPLPEISIMGLGNLADLTEPGSVARFVGEWIGHFPFENDSKYGRKRIHWLFLSDQTFFASVLRQYQHNSEDVQTFDMISGTYSQEDGWLLLNLSKKPEPLSFAYVCGGSSWEITKEGAVLKIPVSFHEDSKTLALHKNVGPYFWAVNVLVKKEN